MQIVKGNLLNNCKVQHFRKKSRQAGKIFCFVLHSTPLSSWIHKNYKNSGNKLILVDHGDTFLVKFPVNLCFRKSKLSMHKFEKLYLYMWTTTGMFLSDWILYFLRNAGFPFKSSDMKNKLIVQNGIPSDAMVAVNLQTYVISWKLRGSFDDQ